MKLSDGEKLIAMMLADIMEANEIRGEFEPSFIKEAIASGHVWALKRKYSGIFHDYEPDPAVVEETGDILNLCRILENSIKNLDPRDQGEIPEVDRQVWIGFDANHDDHYGVARMQIEEMGLWIEFKDRPLNSHHEVLERYRNMRSRYEAEGARYPLPLSSIKKIIGI